jgi:hypothetical protein
VGGGSAREIFQEPRGRAIRIWAAAALAPLGAAALCGLAWLRAGVHSGQSQARRRDQSSRTTPAMRSSQMAPRRFPEEAIKRHVTQRRLAAEIAHLVDGKLDLNHGRGAVAVDLRSRPEDAFRHVIALAPASGQALNAPYGAPRNSGHTPDRRSPAGPSSRPDVRQFVCRADKGHSPRGRLRHVNRLLPTGEYRAALQHRAGVSSVCPI